MAGQKPDDQLEHIYCSYVRIRGCSPEDLPEVMNEEVAREGQDIGASGMMMMMMMIDDELL